MNRPVPQPDQIRREFNEVSAEIVASETTGAWLDGHEEADRLLDMYLDLGYHALSTTSTLTLLPAPAQGYEAEEYDGA